MKPIILASSSPRRKQLFDQTGLPYTVDPSNIDESRVKTSDPHELVRTLSLLKAREVATRHPNSIIIAADTTVFYEGKILGKPIDAKNARQMLLLLSDKTHSVITGFTIIDTETGTEVTDSIETTVQFHPLTDEQIDEYIKTGEAFDKAGAYALQEGLSAKFVKKIEGDRESAIGLPVKQILKLIISFTR